MNNQSKAAFLSKPNIAISQTGEDLDLKLEGKPRGKGSGREKQRGIELQHKLTGSGVGFHDASKSPFGAEQHPTDGAFVHRGRSFQQRVDQYIQELECQLSFSDFPPPPHLTLPTKIQSNVPRNSNSHVPASDPASGGLANGRQKKGISGVLKAGKNDDSSPTVAKPPPAMQRSGMRNINTLKQTAYFSGIPAIPAHQWIPMQPNGTLGASTMEIHHMPGVPSSHPPFPNLAYANNGFGLHTYPFPANVHYPNPVPTSQQSVQPYFATGVHPPQNGYIQGFLPPAGVMQTAPTDDTISHQLSPPDSQEHSPGANCPHSAVNGTQASGPVQIANGQPPLLTGSAQHPTASPSTFAAVPPAASSGHEMAQSAPNPISRSAPTPARTPAVPEPPAASTKPQLYPQPRASGSNDIQKFPQAKPDLQGSSFRATSQMEGAVSSENEGQKASRDLHFKLTDLPPPHTNAEDVNESDGKESGNSTEGHNEESCGPLSQPPSSNENTATSTGATQTAIYSSGPLGSHEEACETVIDSDSDPQTATREARQELAGRASTALAAQSDWAEQDTSTPHVERPMTNAERLAIKLANAELVEEDEHSEENKPMNQAPIPLNSDTAQWPSLGESRHMGKKGNTKKSTKQDIKLGGTPGPKPDQGPNPGSGSTPRPRLFRATIHTNVDWNIILQQMTTDFSANPRNNSYFASTGSAPLAKDKDGLAKLFDKYREPRGEEDKLDVNGTLKYLQDLGLNIETAEIFVPLEIVQAPSLSELPKDAFVDGWKKYDADTIAKQKAYVAGQIKQLSVDMALFKRVYRHVFVCSRDQGQKALNLDSAIIYWELIFSPPGKPWVTGTGSATTNWLSLWVEFLKANWTRSVNKDMWNQTFEFFQKTMQDETLGFWSEDGAWPGVIDDFVAYVKVKRGDLPDTMETD